MRDQLCTVEEVTTLIHAGRALLLAGEEVLLRRLPPGRWIAGTIPYFVEREGGLTDRERIFVNELAPGLACQAVRRYGEATLSRVYADLAPGTFGVIIAPSASAVHLAFALDAPNYPGFALRPLVGWIAGVHLSELGQRAALVFDGTEPAALADQAVVMQIAPPAGMVAQVGLLNIFRQGHGPVLSFPESGFTARQVLVDGVPRNLAEWAAETRLDTRLPLVADYCGAAVNVSFQAVDAARGEVRFYAPVFAGLSYRHAAPVADYHQAFVRGLPQGIEGKLAFSCNCILNYLFSGLEGRRTGSVAGPVTFGEVAYQLLNQTLAYLTIEDARRG